MGIAVSLKTNPREFSQGFKSFAQNMSSVSSSLHKMLMNNSTISI